MPTVFFPWQSDRPEKLGRYFIEKSLRVAIDNLTRDLVLQEAVRESEVAENSFLRPVLSNRPKRPHLRPVVNVRIIGAEPRNSYVARFVDKFCKTRQVCNANRPSDSKEAISDGTARQETL